MLDLARVKLIPIAMGFCLGVACCSAFRPDAQESHARGREMLRSGQYEEAIEQFETALKSSPDHEGSQTGILEALRETGRYELAQKRAEGFPAAREAAAGLHVEMGRILAARGEYTESEKHFRRAIGLGGDRRLAASRELAALLEETGRRSDAESIWRQVLEEYKKRQLRGSEALGIAALAAWRLGYAQDAKDLFLDATSGSDASLRALADFGFLFLEKYNSSDAAGVFRDCLKINKRYPDALLGMALAKRFEKSDQTESFARTALEVNPNLVPALTLLAELRMQEEDYERAREFIRKALAVNPKSLEALSLEAVYYLFRSDSDHFAQVERKVLEINRGYGRFYHTLAENLVMRRKYEEAVEFNRKAISLDPKLYAAHASLGINLMRIGEILEGRRWIQHAFDGDPFNVWAFNTLDLLDQMGKFEEARSDHFVFRMAAEDKAALSRYAPKLAEEAYTKLTQRYGFTPQGQIQVEFYPDHAGFAVRTLGLPGLGAFGVCFGKVIAQDSPRARPTGSFNWGTTLWHEFAHVISLQMSRHNVPRWFSEGISVYEERRARPGWGDDLTALFVKMHKEGKLLSVSELNFGMMRPKFPEQVGLSYYQASLVCELMEERFGFAKIREALLLYAENHSTEEVFRRALGWDMATLDREYAKFLDDRLQTLGSRLNFKRMAENEEEYAKKETLSEILKKDPEDFFGNVRMGSILRREKANQAAEVYLKKAQSLFPEFVEGGNPYHLLMDIYLEEGREEDALAQIDGWIRYDENVILPLQKAGEILRKKKNWNELKRVMELQTYIQPADPEVHTALGEAAAETGDWGTAIASYQVLVGLNPIDPASAHFNLARALYGSGKKQEAKREVLRALEIAPHFEKAQQLLLKLSAGSP